MIDEKLLKEIRLYLQAKTRILYFKDIRKTGDNLKVTCPFHKEGQESKPSAYIRTTAGDKAPEGFFHCFTCGQKMPLLQVMQTLLGDNYNENEIESLFSLKTLQIQSNILQVRKPRLFEIPNKTDFTYNETELNRYKYYHPYLAQRGISEKTALHYDIGYDSSCEQITFPIRDKLRYCKGIGRRSISKKMYRYPPGMKKPLYGVYELPQKVAQLFVVEGPFNLWSLYEWGKSGVALLGTGTEQQYIELLTIECEEYILALDPDEAGRKGIYKLGTFLSQNSKKDISVTLLPDGKDVNDLKQEEFKRIQLVTFKEWKRMFSQYCIDN